MNKRDAGNAALSSTGTMVAIGRIMVVWQSVDQRTVNPSHRNSAGSSPAPSTLVGRTNVH